MYSTIEENYLKAILMLSRDTEDPISTSSIARELDVNAASVTDMIQKRLLRKGLVDYQAYKGVRLTEKGSRVAVTVVRRHRIWEVFLVEKLHYDWEEVHDIAEQLEHVQSTDLIDRLDDFLGHPVVDPHGGPIPGKDGQMRVPPRALLSSMQPGMKARILGVRDDTRELLSFLSANDLLPGTDIEVLEVFSFDQSVRLGTQYGEKTVSRQVTDQVYVGVLEKGEGC